MQVPTRMDKALNDTVHLQLLAGDAGARDAVDAAVTAALAKQGAPRLVIELSGDSLPAGLVASLVAGLRRVREVGGAIAIDPRSPELRDAMALHGLDRVFALPIDPNVAPRSRGRRWVPRIAVTAAIAAFFGMFAGVPSPASAELYPVITTPSDPAAIAAINHVIERNPSLASYQGRLHVDLKMVSFPFLRQHLDGTTYYKRPSNYEVVFDHVPGYAKGFEKLYTDIGDPSNWQRRFLITEAGEAMVGNHHDIALRMVQRVRGMIDHETVLVDPATWSIDQITYDYYNGGSITMSQQFQNLGGYVLLVSQRADIAIPHVRAVASGTYDGYQTNVAVYDGVFAQKN